MGTIWRKTMADCMNFPDTVEEFMEQYKVTDYKHIYTNGAELIPIFRMKQWFERQSSADVAPMEPQEIGYDQCANAMLKMWMDNVVTDREYNRIMNKLNKYYGKS